MHYITICSEIALKKNSAISKREVKIKKIQYGIESRIHFNIAKGAKVY